MWNVRKSITVCDKPLQSLTLFCWEFILTACLDPLLSAAPLWACLSPLILNDCVTHQPDKKHLTATAWTTTHQVFARLRRPRLKGIFLWRCTSNCRLITWLILSLNCFVQFVLLNTAEHHQLLDPQPVDWITSGDSLSNFSHVIMCQLIPPRHCRLSVCGGHMLLTAPQPW